MAKFVICRNCGDHLDFGERCDCEEREEEKIVFWQSRITQEQDGQGSFRFELERMVV